MNSPNIRAGLLSFFMILPLKTETLRQISRTVYQNETNCKKENMLIWNEKEAFPSLGVGHAIWFPEGVKPGYHETFPELAAFLKTKISKNVVLPSELEAQPVGPAPWKTREDFLKADKTQLMEFLSQPEVIQWQTEFMVQRAQKSLNQILKEISQQKPDGAKKAAQIRHMLKKFTAQDEGVISLVDFVNFKGDGLNPNEVTPTDNHSWGLKVVLEKMPETHPDTSVCNKKDLRHYSENKCLQYVFAESVFWALARLTQNWGTPGSEAQLTREKWLQGGWVRRIRETYLPGSLERLNCQL